MEIIEYVSQMKNTSRVKKCSPEQITKAEKDLGLSFSEEYKALLLDGCPSNVYFTVCSIDADYDVVYATKFVRSIYSNLPKNLYVLIGIGEDMFILQDERGKIYQIDDTGGISQTFKSFLDFLKYFYGSIQK